MKVRRYQVVALLALLAGALLAVYPLMPVDERAAHYNWRLADGPADIPLSPYRPASIEIEVDGDIPQGPLIDTVRSAEPQLQDLGLSLERRGDELITRVGGASLSHEIVENRPVLVSIDGQDMFMGHDPRRGRFLEGDHRPVVDSFTATDAAVQARTQLSVHLEADTRFDSHPSPAKIIVGVLAVALLVTALVLLWLTVGRPRAPGVRRTGRWRPRIEDGIVLVATALGVLAGGATDDDGFIRLIAGTAHNSGHLGNYVRWNNVPEAPFGWQYEVVAWLGEVSWEPVWLRLLPWLVALAGWLLLRHLLLPRLVPQVGGWPRAVLTATFLLGWLIYGNSLRPELLFAVGTALVWWLVLRAVANHSVMPLVLAFIVVSWTIGTGPTGVWAVTPILVAAPALWGWLRHEGWLAVAVGVLALTGLGSVFVVMFADQSMGTVIAATEARTAFGPTYPVWGDPLRYHRLFTSFATRQVATYWAILALAGLLALVLPVRRAAPARSTSSPSTRSRSFLSPSIPGVEMQPARWLVWVGLLLVPVLAVSPTKLPHHFGALILFGPLAAAVVVHAMTAKERSPRVRPWFTGAVVGSLVAFTGLAFHRANTWWKLGTLGHVADVKPAAISGLTLWPALVVAGLLVGAVAWWTARRRGAVRFWAMGLVLAQIAFTSLTFGNAAQAVLRREPFDPQGRYTMGAAAIDAIRGQGCRLERSLAVELDPTAGVLPVPMSEVDPTTGLPVWRPGGAGAYVSGWVDLPDQARSGELPIVVGVAGADDAHRVRIEFDDGSREDLEPNGRVLGSSNFHDIRVAAPEGAGRMRLVAESDGPSTVERDIPLGAPAAGPNGEVVEFAVLAPRVPEVSPFTSLAQGQTVSTAWNLAFFTPCLRQPVQRDGAVEVPDYILSDAERPGSIAFSAKNGGPFASAIGLRQPTRVPLYAPGDLEEESINELDLIRLEPSGRSRLQPASLNSSERRSNAFSGFRMGPDVAIPGAGD